MKERIFLAIVFLVFVPAIIAVIVVTQLFSTYSREMTVDYIRSATGATARVLETHLANYERLTLQVYYNDQVFSSIGRRESDRVGVGSPQADEISQLLQSIVNSDRHVSSVYLFTEQLRYAEGTEFRGIDAVLNEYREEVIEARGRLVWTPVRTLTSTFAWPYPVFFAMRALRRDDRVVGILMIGIRREMIEVATSELQRVTGSSIAIYNSESNAIYSATSAEQRFTVPPDIEGQAGTRGYYTLDRGGTKFYVVYETVDTPAWLLVTQVSDGPAMSTLRSALNVIWLVLAGFSVALLFVIYLLSRAVTRPLRELDAALERIAAGDLSVRLDQKGVPEVSRLIDQFNNMTVKVEQLIHDVREQSERKTQAELRSLRLQLSPHFLYNTLNTVRWMATMNGQHSIREIIEALTHLLHNMSKIADESIPLRTELDLLHSYVQIQGFRYDDFHYEEDIPQNALDAYVPPFILQPLVENSIVHGFAWHSHEDRITVTARVDGDRLNLVVEDNGVGIEETADGPPSHDAHNEHTGLRNLEERVRLRYGPEYGLTLCEAPGGGTRAAVILPLEYGG